MDDWIQTQLSTRIIQELETLLNRLRANTPRMKNLAASSLRSEEGVIQTFSDLECLQEIGIRDDPHRLLVRLPRHRSGVSLEDPTTNEVDLSTLPESFHKRLIEVVEQIRLIDRKHALRQAIVHKSDLSAPHLRSLIGRPGRQASEGCKAFTLSTTTTRGQLAVPAMTALMRWKLYNGQGWEEYDPGAGAISLD